MLSVLVLLLGWWPRRRSRIARSGCCGPSVVTVCGSRFRDEVVAMSRRQRRRAFWGQCTAVRVVRGRDGVGRRAGGRHGRLGVTVRRRFASGPSACPAAFVLCVGLIVGGWCDVWFDWGCSGVGGEHRLGEACVAACSVWVWCRWRQGLTLREAMWMQCCLTAGVGPGRCPAPCVPSRRPACGGGTRWAWPRV